MSDAPYLRSMRGCVCGGTPDDYRYWECPVHGDYSPDYGELAEPLPPCADFEPSFYASSICSHCGRNRTLHDA